MQIGVWDRFGKSIVSAFVAVAMVLIPQVSGDGRIDINEGILIGAAVGNALLTYIVPLSPQFKSIKSVVHAVLASLGVAGTLVAGGVDANDWLLIITTGLGVLGVTVAPAASMTPVSVMERGTNVIDGKAVVSVGTGSDS